MKKKTRSKAAAVPQVDPYLEGLMSKLLDRLVSLENKIDSLAAQASARPAGSGDASKPFQNPAQKPQEPRRDRVLYEAICADCHKVCEVPFKPSEDRAVYCKECFARRKSGGHKHGMPILTPVALPPRAASQPSASMQTQTATLPAAPASQKGKKSSPAKKSKKKR